ncbi:hypothetical protein [Agaribacterium sp. ZY112]|uniref:hypothetical protein n=1 Tax=Agaribacterium sp. ZY112 TaxID=3233574 RepID=UPI0035242452
MKYRRLIVLSLSALALILLAIQLFFNNNEQNLNTQEATKKDTKNHKESSLTFNKKNKLAPPIRASIKEVGPQQTESNLDLLCLEQLHTFSNNDDFEQCANDLVVLSGENKELSNLRTLFTHWLNVDLQASLNYLLSLDVEHRDYLLSWILKGASTIDFEATLSWLEDQHFERDIYIDAVTSIYNALAYDDPEQAIYYAEQLKNHDLKSHVIDNILETWANKNADLAIQWIDRQPRPDFYSDIKTSLFLLLIQQDAQKAGDYLNNLAETESKSRLVIHYAHQLATQDIKHAIIWSENLNDHSTYRAAILPILELAVQDSEYQTLALDIALAQKDKALRDKLVIDLSLQIAAKNPNLIADRMTQFPDATQTKVSGILAQKMYERNANTAIEWVNSLPFNAASDYAKRIIGENILTNDWNGALKLADTIQSQNERFLLIKQTVSHINRTNPEQARSIVESLTELSTDEHEQLKKSLQ